MAPLNPFPARPAARPAAQQNDPHRQPQQAWPGQHPAQDQHAGDPWAQHAASQAAPAYAAPAADPYAPQFEPYSAQPQAYAAQPGYQAAAPQPAQQAFRPAQQPAQAYGQAPSYAPAAAPSYAPAAAPAASAYGYGAQAAGAGQAQPAQTHWGAQQQPQSPAVDPHGFDVGAYGGYQNQPGHGYGQSGYDGQGGDWNQGGAASGYGADPYRQPGSGADIGFAQPAGGELDQGYEDDGEYEYEEPRSRPRFMMMAAALAGAIIVGGGMAYGYRAVFGSSSGEPPVIKSALAPSKTKPADSGGKTFDHADRKIMGRLGEGSAATASTSAEAAVDENGTRKVSTLVVGRDGSIQAPPEKPAEFGGVPGTALAVPGMTVVDAFGGHAATASPSHDQTPAPTPAKVVVEAPPAAAPVTPKTVNADAAKAQSAPAAETGSIEPAAGPEKEPEVAAAPPVKPAKKVKVAAAEPAAASDAYSPPPVTAAAGGSSGFVAVLASVPRSESSRMDALKRFADLQQKYGTTLAGKTPDVAEANLGTKGNYHRLVVGPPGSRQQASALCTQLKSEGFTDCWVTSY